MGENLILKDYLQHEISGLNGKVRNIIFRTGHSFRDANQMALGYNSVLEGFAGRHCMFSEIEEARTHISEHNKRLSVYNYFNVDTLIGYKEYLKTFVNFIYGKLDKNSSKSFSSSRISENLFEEAISYSHYCMESHKGIETLLYDNRNPVHLETRIIGANQILYPRPTPRKDAFYKKYPEYNTIDCDNMVIEYIENKLHLPHSENKEIVKEKQSQKKEERIVGLIDTIEQKEREERRKQNEYEFDF